ncbi:Response regulator receiver domain-containing protein [Burkholderia sp. b13]|nr:Response regulator receiver domain-containing protein [Burkholderia sp. b13]
MALCSAAFLLYICLTSDFTMASQPVQPSSSVSSATAAAGGALARHGLRVLVVDDAEDACEGLALLLQIEGFQVEATLDGPTAVECATHFAPHIVLLDLAMPRMSGYDVARRLREHPSTRDALIIALTGLSEFDDIARSRAAGFNHHQVKPVDVDTLLSLIDHHFATHASQRSGRQ